MTKNFQKNEYINLFKINKMKFNPTLHHRRSIRLKGYDYSQAGLYFVTICVQNHQCIFGQIKNGEMMLNENGQIVQMVWNELPQHYNHIELGEFVIMPNHIHGIIVINPPVGAGFKPAPTGGKKLWQRNYWEHIIRNEQSHQRIADYIANNPVNWGNDEFFMK